MSAKVWLQEDGSVALSCPTCKFKIHVGKKDMYLDVVVCSECKATMRNPIGTAPVYIEVPDDTWEDMGATATTDDDWEDVSEDFLAATSDASSEDVFAATPASSSSISSF